MKCDELKKYKAYEFGGAFVYHINEVDEAIAELKDKCQMHDFFWEGCGFAKRGFKNTIAVSEAFDRLEAENAELKKKLMPCLNGDCILTCEVVEKYGKENAELKAKLESVQASAYADSVDAGMRERRLRRALYKACANWAHEKDARYYLKYVCISDDARIGYERWRNVERKCRAKAEEYR